MFKKLFFSMACGLALQFSPCGYADPILDLNVRKFLGTQLLNSTATLPVLVI